MTLALLFSLKTTASLENGLQPYSGVTLLFSMRTVLLASLSQRWRWRCKGSGMLDPGLELHQCLYVCKYMGWKHLGHGNWPRGQQVSHQRWIWGIHCMQAITYTNERMHPSFKTQDRHPKKSKTGISGPTKMTDVFQKRRIQRQWRCKSSSGVCSHPCAPANHLVKLPLLKILFKEQSPCPSVLFDQTNPKALTWGWSLIQQNTRARGLFLL